MKKTSLLSALLFLAGVLVGGTAVFFFLRPAPQSTQVSEPVAAPSIPAETELSDEQMPAGLEEAEEIPAEGGSKHAAPVEEEHHEVDSE
jgi:hypothetical protein